MYVCMRYNSHVLKITRISINVGFSLLVLTILDKNHSVLIIFAYYITSIILHLNEAVKGIKRFIGQNYYSYPTTSKSDHNHKRSKLNTGSDCHLAIALYVNSFSLLLPLKKFFLKKVSTNLHVI